MTVVDRAKAVERSVRRQRVERSEMEPCDICGGAEVAVVDQTLACTCDADRAEVVARTARLAYDHADRDQDDRSDEIAP